MNIETLRPYRLSLGLTQEKFAHQLGVSLITYSRWENGHKKPSPLAVDKINQHMEANKCKTNS